MSAHDNLGKQFAKLLGPEATPEHHGDVWDTIPSHVFRVMSEHDYQTSVERGYHQSDERETYPGMARRGEIPEEEASPEGTVASRVPFAGYLSHAEGGHGRVVKIAVHPDDEWEFHPDYEEGDAFRTFKPIPSSRFVGDVRARWRGGRAELVT